jgi:hypothetical protein
MKITPDLFTHVTPPPRPARDASQARLAFEAMLSAGAARQTIVARGPEIAPRAALPQRATSQAPAKDNGDTPLARPGRVLDIRV